MLLAHAFAVAVWHGVCVIFICHSEFVVAMCLLYVQRPRIAFNVKVKAHTNCIFSNLEFF